MLRVRSLWNIHHEGLARSPSAAGPKKDPYAIAARFNNTILHCARELYDIQADSMSPLDGFESFIYRFQRPDGEFILRIGHSGRRSPEMIHGEVDWINYLSDHGVTVARAILSTSRNLVEAIEDEQGGQFLCTAFVRAPGGEIQREQINERFFRAYGSLIGKMHALSKTYEPSNPAWRREEWDGEMPAAWGASTRGLSPRPPRPRRATGETDPREGVPGGIARASSRGSWRRDHAGRVRAHRADGVLDASPRPHAARIRSPSR